MWDRLSTSSWCYFCIIISDIQKPNSLLSHHLNHIYNDEKTSFSKTVSYWQITSNNSQKGVEEIHTVSTEKNRRIYKSNLFKKVKPDIKSTLEIEVHQQQNFLDLTNWKLYNSLKHKIYRNQPPQTPLLLLTKTNHIK